MSEGRRSRVGSEREMYASRVTAISVILSLWSAAAIGSDGGGPLPSQTPPVTHSSVSRHPAGTVLMIVSGLDGTPVSGAAVTTTSGADSVLHYVSDASGAVTLADVPQSSVVEVFAEGFLRRRTTLDDGIVLSHGIVLSLWPSSTPSSPGPVVENVQTVAYGINETVVANEVYGGDCANVPKRTLRRIGDGTKRIVLVAPESVRSAYDLDIDIPAYGYNTFEEFHSTAIARLNEVFPGRVTFELASTSVVPLPTHDVIPVTLNVSLGSDACDGRCRNYSASACAGGRTDNSGFIREGFVIYCLQETIYNGRPYKYVTVDARTIVHEFGHVLGLTHSSDPHDAMFNCPVPPGFEYPTRSSSPGSNPVREPYST